MERTTQGEQWDAVVIPLMVVPGMHVTNFGETTGKFTWYTLRCVTLSFFLVECSIALSTHCHTERNHSSKRARSNTLLYDIVNDIPPIITPIGNQIIYRQFPSDRRKKK